MSIDPQSIRAEPFTEIGSIILRDSGMMIQRWSRRAETEQPNALRSHHDALLDHLPSLLKAIADSLTKSQGTQPSEHERLAVIHGEHRWEAGWSLTEVVRDYQILRLVILDYLEETLDRQLRYREMMAIGLSLDEAIGASVAMYVSQRDEQMEEVETALREADGRKNDFLATLAHELRNPLAPLRNGVELLRRFSTSDDTLLQIRDIFDRQVQQLIRLVDNLLDVTRIAQGKLQLQPERVDLAVVLQRAAQSTEWLMNARGHQLEVDCPEDSLWVHADPARLVQVVSNLLNNAAKYTESAGHIRLSAERVDNNAVIRVVDNGIGISPDLLPRVFDMFTQAEWLSDRSQGGLGIGLSLVRRLVELQGGTVTARSDGEGQGSEFAATFPLSTESPSNPSKNAAEGAPRPHRVLIIEDHADGRETLATLLRISGHHVDVAENGTRGIELAVSLQPEIVLIDLELPDISGWEVADKLRDTFGDSIVLVALTGSSQPADYQRSTEVGFDHHLIKPVDPKVLQSVFARVQ